MPANHLPDDIAALKRIVASRDETIAQLLAEISRLKRWQYGRSSERMTELMETHCHSKQRCRHARLSNRTP
jgi:transposase